MPNPPGPLSTTQPISSGVESITLQLRESVGACRACRRSLEGHTYRFFSCHPASTNPEDEAFRAAIDNGEWATVHAMQTPSVGQPSYAIYAIACPGQSSGMVIALHSDAISGEVEVHRRQELSPQHFAALRALCPTCQWVSFTSVLKPLQESV